MKTLIVGAGEIGKALYEIFSWQYETELIDKETIAKIEPEIMHICFPYSDGFIEEVKKYKRFYTPRYIVIHSTVPVGTSRKCEAIHSPVIGKHPFLMESIKTFVKFLGGKKTSEVADYFRRAGLKIYIFDDPETTEYMKLMDTAFYALCIEYAKEVKRGCKNKALPFEAWTIWTNEYNNGYQKLGYPEFTRPNLIPIMKKVGGHCLIPNLDLIDNKFTEFLKKIKDE